MSTQDFNADRLELALEAAGLDLWENNLVTGEVARSAAKTFLELGYGKEEATSYLHDYFKIIHPEDIPVVKSAIDDHLNGTKAQYRCEFRIRAKNGTWVWHANYGKIMDQGGAHPGERFIGVTFNIDDRKRKEDELVQLEHNTRTLIENFPDTVARYDCDCRRIYVNSAFCDMAGCASAKLLGTTPSEFPGGPDAIRYEARIIEVFATGNDVQLERTWQGNLQSCPVDGRTGFNRSHNLGAGNRARHH